MKKIFFFIVYIVFVKTSLMSQTIISGTIKNNGGNTLPGVNIIIKNSYDGATSDSNGGYSFITYETGEQTIQFSIMGYTTYEKTINVVGDTVIVDATLKKDSHQLDAVVVTAGSFEAGDQKRASTVLNSLDILTTGGANADITASLKTLPGAQQLGEQEGLAVRGGSTGETKQFIDGTLVSKPYYTGVPNVAQRGRFSPTLFKGTVFSTGGYSALYGQALSSALILESIDLPTQSQAHASLTTVGIAAGFQNLSQNRKSSWGIDGSYTNISPYYHVVKQRLNFYDMPVSYDLQGNFRIKTKSGGILKLYSNLSHNKVGAQTPSIENDNFLKNMDIKNVNWYNNVSWREYLGNDWKMNLGLSYSYNKDEFNQTTFNPEYPNDLPINIDSLMNYNLKSTQNFAQAKLVFEKKFRGNHVLRLGEEYWHESDKKSFHQYDTYLNDNFFAVFAETDLHLSGKLAAKIGLRGEYSGILNRWNIAPRTAISYKTGRFSQISAAYGIFFQKPENQQLLITHNLNYEQATHYILNYNYSSTNKTMRLEGFYKTYNNLVKTATDYNNNGSGYARGAEIYWRDKQTFRYFDYWLSYSYIDTRREYLNFPEKLQPDFAANHTATLVVKSFFTKINTGFNITYSFASGRPYYNFMKNVNGDYYIADKGKTINYNDLGFSLNWLVNWLGSNSVVVASVTNILGQKQVYGYNYSANGSIKQPILPTADRFFFIGIFMSWGVDRSKDILDGRY